jgi:quinol monooxygenase YgiN
MILVTGAVRIDLAQREAAIGLAVWMQQRTRTEPGCLEYTFALDLEDSALVHVTERWADQAALEAHFRTEHMRQFNAQLPAYLASVPVVHAHTVSSTQKL